MSCCLGKLTPHYLGELELPVHPTRPLASKLRIELATGWVEGENIATPHSAREGRLLLGRQAREVASAWF